MSEEIQPKFFTFMQCTFGNSEWDSISISKLSNEKQWDYGTHVSLPIRWSKSKYSGYVIQGRLK